MEKLLHWGSGIAATLLSFLFGGFSMMLGVLLFFMFCDILSGTLKALYLRNLDSETDFRSLVIKKFAMMLAISVVYQIDRFALTELTQNFFIPEPMFTLLVIAFIKMEFVSINENLGKIIEFPEPYRNLFKQLRDNTKGEDEK